MINQYAKLQEDTTAENPVEYDDQIDEESDEESETDEESESDEESDEEDGRDESSNLTSGRSSPVTDNEENSTGSKSSQSPKRDRSFVEKEVPLLEAPKAKKRAVLQRSDEDYDVIVLSD